MLFCKGNDLSSRADQLRQPDHFFQVHIKLLSVVGDHENIAGKKMLLQDLPLSPDLPFLFIIWQEAFLQDVFRDIFPALDADVFFCAGTDLHYVPVVNIFHIILTFQNKEIIFSDSQITLYTEEKRVCFAILSFGQILV